MRDDRRYMELAYSLALKGQGATSPNPMVGAVIVKNHRIIGQGWHKRCGSAHAEIFALRQAKAAAKGATLYVTLEPCAHFGRTPPCVDAVIQSGVKEVVVGMLDPNGLTNGKSVRKLRQNGIKVRVGMLEKELRQMNQAFVKYITAKTPLVTAKIAETLDGKTATVTGQSQWITSSAARRFSHRQRDSFDAILVGINTILKDDPQLAPAKKTKHLKKIVLDSRLRVPLSARIFKRNPQDCVIATISKSNPAKILALNKKGAQVILCPAKTGKVDLRWLLRELARQGITSVLIEGGATVIGAALQQKLVDKFHIFIAPKILGDERALSAVKGRRISRIQECLDLRNIRVRRVGADLLVEGEVKY